MNPTTNTEAGAVADVAAIARRGRSARRARRNRMRSYDFKPIELYAAGDVVMCTRDAALYLKRGVLYRVRERVPACHAYWLEGIEGIGFWATRLARPQAPYSRSGPIVRLAVRQHLEQGATAGVAVCLVAFWEAGKQRAVLDEKDEG